MQIEILNIENTKLVKKVVDLGTKNSKTLGHFPEGAFLDHIKKGYVFVAQDGENELLGYLMFSITHSKNIIRVIHLCIDDKYRGKQIGVDLLNALKQRYLKQLRGIALSCREDYTVATKFWENYGFKPLDRRRSKSKKENYLIKWWYDFGRDDLFSTQFDRSNSIRAVLDANIIIKKRDGFEDGTSVKFLFADWLDDVHYYYAPEIYNEINRDEDKLRAELTRRHIRNYSQVKFKPDLRDKIFNEISSLIQGNTRNDISDKKQLAECIASDIEYFISTDRKILDNSDKIYELYGVQCLRPSDFILLIDELKNKTNYYVSRLSGTRFDYKRIQSFQIDNLVDNFLAKDKGEKKHALRDKLTAIAGDIENSRIMLVEDKEKEVLGIWGGKILENEINIKFLRTVKSRLSTVLFKQFIFNLIKLSIEKNRPYLIINDPFLNNDQANILSGFGFFYVKNRWMKLVDFGMHFSKNYFANNNITKKFWDNNIILNNLDSNGSEYKLRIERLLFPLKFIDLNIPVYIVPIKPYWAGQLFDHFIASEELFGALPELSWNRENVYYRSVKPIMEDSPGRILWYASKDTSHASTRSSAIIACSYLDNVNIGKPKELFQRFKYYGTYKWNDVYQLAKRDTNNTIKALEFSDTEVFEKPISLMKINQILLANGRKKNTFPCPLKVDNNIFKEIYLLGKKSKQ